MAKSAREFSHNSEVLSPCKDCKERRAGCHSECENYKEYKQTLYKLHKEQYKQNNADSEATGHEVESKLRTIKRKGKQ